MHCRFCTRVIQATVGNNRLTIGLGLPCIPSEAVAPPPFPSRTDLCGTNFATIDVNWMQDEGGRGNITSLDLCFDDLQAPIEYTLQNLFHDPHFVSSPFCSLTFLSPNQRSLALPRTFKSPKSVRSPQFRIDHPLRRHTKDLAHRMGTIPVWGRRHLKERSR